jgi:hypothetical protein
MKIVSLTTLLVMLGLVTGCIESKTVYIVKKDGSGTVLIEDYLAPQMTSVMDSMAQQMNTLAGGGNATADVAAPKQSNLFQAQIDGRCEQIGDDLKLVSQQTTTNAAGWKGYCAVFAFKNIATLKVPGSDADIMPNPAEKKVVPPSYTFQFAPGLKPTLKIVPTPKPKNAAPAKEEDPMAAQMAAAMVGSMLKGARNTIIVQVEGDIAMTNAKFVNGKHQVVLIDVPIDKFAGNPEAMKVLASKSPDQQERLSKMTIPGVRVEDPTKTITITY